MLDSSLLRHGSMVSETHSRKSMVSGHLNGPAPRASVVSGHLNGPLPRASVVSGHLPGAPPGGPPGIRMSIVAGQMGSSSGVLGKRKTRMTGVGPFLETNPVSVFSSPDDKTNAGVTSTESGEGFRQRVHRLADRLADEHESEIRQLHDENVSLRKRCGLPAASPRGSKLVESPRGTELNGTAESFRPECSTNAEPESVSAGTVAGDLGVSALQPLCELGSVEICNGKLQPDGFDLQPRDMDKTPADERPLLEDLSCETNAANGSASESDAMRCSKASEVETKPNSQAKNSWTSEHSENCTEATENVDEFLPGSVGEAGGNHSNRDVVKIEPVKRESVVPECLQSFVKTADMSVEVDNVDLCDERSSCCFSDSDERVARMRTSVASDAITERQEEFQLRSFWHAELRRTEFAQMARTINAEDFNENDKSYVMNVQDDDYEGWLRKFISYPSSFHRVFWDVMGMLLIGYDIIVIPLEAFKLPDNAFMDFMNWVTLLFWSADMVTTFFVGYMEKGVTILHPYKIAKHYVQTWFFVDVLVVGSDWAFMLVNSTQSNVGALGRLLKVLRAIRTLRLVRLLKLKKMMEMVNDYIDSEHVAIAVSVCRLVFLLLMSSHFIACAWYAIGDVSRSDGRSNWVERYAASPHTTAYCYFTAMHWSLTQFTPASIDVQPSNVAERTFAIVVLVFALITFSSFLSTITSSMSQLHAMKEDTMRQFWLLRRFLRERQVAKVLALRIQRYVEYAWMSQNNTVQEGKVKMLALLSDQLRGELRSATTEPHLNTHPLFQLIFTASNVLIQRLSITAIDWRLLADSDSVFFAGEAANFMYYVVSGELQYIKGFDPRWVYHGEWICEPVLWTEWIHLGELRSFTECDLINIDATKFGETVRTNPMMQRLVRSYAERYVEKLNAFDARVLSDVDYDMMHTTSEDMEALAIDSVEEPTNLRLSLDPRISQYRHSRAYGRHSVLTGAAGISHSTAGMKSDNLSEIDDGDSQGMCSEVSRRDSATQGDDTVSRRVSLESLERYPSCNEIKRKKSLTGRPVTECKIQVVPMDPSCNQSCHSSERSEKSIS